MDILPSEIQDIIYSYCKYTLGRQINHQAKKVCDAVELLNESPVDITKKMVLRYMMTDPEEIDVFLNHSRKHNYTRWYRNIDNNGVLSYRACTNMKCYGSPVCSNCQGRGYIYATITVTNKIKIALSGNFNSCFSFNVLEYILLNHPLNYCEEYKSQRRLSTVKTFIRQIGKNFYLSMVVPECVAIKYPDIYSSPGVFVDI
jgi:hypothetical protein